MKHVQATVLFALAAMMMTGCGGSDEKKSEKKASTNVSVSTSLNADLCGKCGCCSDCETHCEEGAETCDDCGMKPGSALCCTGVEKADVVYCKDCGFDKKSEKCCAESNETCACGMAKGSDLCCKLKDKSEETSQKEDGEKDE